MLEQPCRQYLDKSKTYLGHRCSKDHNFIELPHPLHELVYAWALNHIYIVIVALYFNWYGEVGLVKDLWHESVNGAQPQLRKKQITLNEL